MAVAWEAFVASVLSVMHNKGRDYIASAHFPEPQADKIGDDYEVPVVAGEPGYTDKHNRFSGL